MRLEYSNVEIDNDPAHVWTVKFDLTLKGDTYQVEYEWNENGGIGQELTVTFEGINQYYEVSTPNGWREEIEDKDTYFSRTVDEDQLSDWIKENILDQIWTAQRKVIDYYRGGKGIFFLEEDK